MVSTVLAFVVVLAVLALVFGAAFLVLRFLWLLATTSRLPAPPRAPSPPDDWDDEEYIARHHH